MKSVSGLHSAEQNYKPIVTTTARATSLQLAANNNLVATFLNRISMTGSKVEWTCFPCSAQDGAVAVSVQAIYILS